MKFYMGMAFCGDPLSLSNAYLREPRVKCIMISYYYYKYNATVRFITERLIAWNRGNPDDRIDIMVDSGAFSLMVNEEKMKGINIDDYVVGYGDFITHYQDQINRFVELDIQSIVGAREYERLYNLLCMRAPSVKKPTIVWHVTEDLSKFDADLSRCIDNGDDLICIGGAAALKITSNRSLGRMMRHLCWYAAGRGIKVHGLGITSKVARYIDFYSVDSLSFIYDVINNREAEGHGKGKLRDNYGSYGAAIYGALSGKLMQYIWDVY